MKQCLEVAGQSQDGGVELCGVSLHGCGAGTVHGGGERRTSPVQMWGQPRAGVRGHGGGGHGARGSEWMPQSGVQERAKLWQGWVP